MNFDIIKNKKRQKATRRIFFKMIQNMKERMKGDTGAQVSVETIMFLALALVAALLVGTKVKQALDKKSTQVADCIDKAGTQFDGNGNCLGN